MKDNDKALNSIINIGDLKVVTIVNETLAQNCYLICNLANNSSIIIDPGPTSSIINKALEIHNQKVDSIFLTHAHFDHVGCASELSNQFDVKIFMHANDKRLLKMASLYALRFSNKNIQTPKSFEKIDFSQIIWGDEIINIYHTPGHTEGSIAIHVGDLCFTGDTLLKGNITNNDMPGANFEKLIISIDSLFEKLGKNTLILPGHGKPWYAFEAKEWWTSEKMSQDKQSKFRTVVE